jgi:hypothetical protein
MAKTPRKAPARKLASKAEPYDPAQGSLDWIQPLSVPPVTVVRAGTPAPRKKPRGSGRA